MRGRLRNGAVIEVLARGSRVTLPDGSVVPGEPQDSDDYRATAIRLGYGGDTLAMCRDHDPLHAILCERMGVESHALRQAAGLDHDGAIAIAEEAAVLAVQAWLRQAGKQLRDVPW